MAHLDPSVNTDTMPTLTVADFDEIAEAGAIEVVVVEGGQLKKCTIATLATVVDNLIDEGGAVVHTHA